MPSSHSARTCPTAHLPPFSALAAQCPPDILPHAATLPLPDPRPLVRTPLPHSPSTLPHAPPPATHRLRCPHRPHTKLKARPLLEALDTLHAKRRTLGAVLQTASAPPEERGRTQPPLRGLSICAAHLQSPSSQQPLRRQPIRRAQAVPGSQSDGTQPAPLSQSEQRRGGETPPRRDLPPPLPHRNNEAQLASYSDCHLPLWNVHNRRED